MAWQTNKVSDVALIEQWRTQRDAEAFAEIVSRHAGMVFAACNRILGDRAAAEEVSQECLFALACATGEVPTSPGGWLHTVATRLALKRVHSDSKRRVREEVYVEHQQIPTRPEWIDIKHYVDEAVEELPEALRFVVVAHFLEQRTHREIAKELGLTRQAVSYRIRKGIAEIRSRLDQKNITLSIAHLGPMISKNAIEPAPATLLSDLGRMAMVGGKTAETGSAVVLHGSRSAARAFASLAASAIILAAVVVFLSKPEITQDTTTRSDATDSRTDLDGKASLIAPTTEVQEEFVTDVVKEELSLPDIPNPNDFAEEIPGFTSQISGRVVMASNYAPVVGIRVTASNMSTLSSGRAYASHSQEGTTADDGSFSITRLKGAKYELEVGLSEFTQMDLPLVVDTRRAAEASNLVIQLQNFDDELAGMVRGRVTMGGNPVVQASIEYRYDPIERVDNQDVLPQLDPGVRTRTSAQTDQNGEYFLKDLPAGMLSVSASDVSVRGSLARFVEIRKGEETVVDFKFLPAGTSGIEGWVLPADVGAGVSLYAWTRRPNGESRFRFTQPDVSGYFIFKDLSPGSWHILVTPMPVFVRATEGLWSHPPQLSNHELEPGRRLYKPREFYATYGDMMDGRMEGVARLYDPLHSEAWVTTQKGKISRQDFGLSDGKILRGRVTNLFEGESGEVLVLEAATLDTRALDATMVDALKASYPWKQTTLERDGSFRVTGLELESYDLESYTRFIVIVSTSSGRFAASSNRLNSGEVTVNGERIEKRFFWYAMALELR